MDIQQRQTSHDARNRRFTIVAAVSLVCALIAGVLALTLPAVAQTDADDSDDESDQDEPSGGFKWHHGRRWGGPGVGGHVGGDLAELLGLSSSDLRAELRAGETLAELAEAAGVEAGAVVDLLVDQVVARIDTAMEDGRLEAEDRAACIAALEAHITARVDGDQPGGETALSDCRGDELGSTHHRGHRWSADGGRSSRVRAGEGNRTPVFSLGS